MPQPTPAAPPPPANLSLWQRTILTHPLLSPSPPLPPTSDIVVIGGGLCGAALAHSLLTSDHDITVTLLEARTLASGASGRNAGHCRPDPSRGFTSFAKMHGTEESRRVLASERVVFDRMDEFITQNKLDCEWTKRTTYDASLSPEFTAYSANTEAALRAIGGDPEVTRLDGAAAAHATRVDAQAAWRWEAATVNPAQLTMGVHGLCVKTGRYTVCAHAPVTKVDKVHAANGQAEAQKWRISTPKGEIVADKVVWANNAYVAGLCAELEGIVVPVRAQAHKLSPPPDPAFAPLSASYSLRKSISLFYSVAPRPDASIILGVSRGHLPGSETGFRVDDDGFHPALAHAALSAWCELMDGGWRVPALGELEALAARVGPAQTAPADAADALRTQDVPWPTSGTGFEYAWSGIIGCTPDLVPLVGDRVGWEGQFLAVGYNGHGMARILLTAPALAHYILTGEWDPAMPACFRSTAERMSRLRDGVDSGALRAG